MDVDWRVGVVGDTAHEHLGEDGKKEYVILGRDYPSLFRVKRSIS